VLKVNATTTFFINGERIKGAITFQGFDRRIKQLLKN
jgi:protein-disulfide isomerase